MDAAFTRLRTYAKTTDRGLTESADSLVAGTITVSTIRA